MIIYIYNKLLNLLLTLSKTINIDRNINYYIGKNIVDYEGKEKLFVQKNIRTFLESKKLVKKKEESKKDFSLDYKTRVFNLDSVLLSS